MLLMALLTSNTCTSTLLRCTWSPLPPKIWVSRDFRPVVNPGMAFSGRCPWRARHQKRRAPLMLGARSSGVLPSAPLRNKGVRTSQVKVMLCMCGPVWLVYGWLLCAWGGASRRRREVLVNGLPFFYSFCLPLWPCVALADSTLRPLRRGFSVLSVVELNC